MRDEGISGIVRFSEIAGPTGIARDSGIVGISGIQGFKDTALEKSLGLARSMC